MTEAAGTPDGHVEEDVMSVVVPTLREADNLRGLIKAVAEVLDPIGAWEMIVVDSDSRDGSVEIVEGLSYVHPVRIVVREGGGDLSAAVLRGLREARGSVAAVMDADGAHAPSALPRLFAEARTRGMAMGVRAMEPGTSKVRRVAAVLARLPALPLADCPDPLSGFFAVRLADVAWDRLRPSGFKIALEILVRSGLSPASVPHAYAARAAGESKMDAMVVAQYLVQLAHLHAVRLGLAGKVVGNLAVGATGLAVDVAAFLLFASVIDHIQARLLAFVCAASWNWALNATLVFEGDRSACEWGRYLAAAGAGGGVSLGTYALLSETLCPDPALRVAHLLVGVFCGWAANFELSRRWVFAH